MSGATAVSLLLILLGVLSPSPVVTHGGEDCGDANPAAAIGTCLYFTTQSDAFDLVVIPTVKPGEKLRVYPSDVSNNALIVGAKIDVTRREFTAPASEVRGCYELSALWVKTPGHYDLPLSVPAGDASDLLIAGLASRRRSVRRLLRSSGCWVCPRKSTPTSR